MPPASNIRFADIVALGSAVTAIKFFVILYFALPVLLTLPSGEDLYSSISSLANNKLLLRKNVNNIAIIIL